MAFDPKHKHEMLAALDHIDGVLGDAMQQAHQHVQTVAAGAGGDPDPQAGGKYEGQGNAGGHSGHPFGGSKDQHGSQNSHFGHRSGGGEEGGESENPNFPRRGSLMGLLNSK